MGRKSREDGREKAEGKRDERRERGHEKDQSTHMYVTYQYNDRYC